MAEIERETLADQVVTWIADRILSGEFTPGQTIVEGDLAERLQVSRSPIREAIRELAKEGLVTITPRRGVIIAALDAQDGGDLYECRGMLEGFCARLATGVITETRIAELREIIEQMKAAHLAGETAEFQRLNGRFHLGLYEACPNRTVRDLIRLLWRKTMRYRAVLAQGPNRMAESLAAHELVMTAVENRDLLAAEQAVRSLIMNAREVLINLLHSPQTRASVWEKKQTEEAAM